MRRFKTEMHMRAIACIFTVNVLFLSFVSAEAQPVDDHEDYSMDSHAEHRAIQQEKHAVDPHAGHSDKAGNEPDTPKPMSAAGAADHEHVAESSVAHGSMQMQGGRAPADARDPHAYSGGYPRGAGAYALPEGQRLRLADEHSFGAFLASRFEQVDTRDDRFAAYDVRAWYGRDYDRLWFKGDGEVDGSQLREARSELLWGHAVTTFWDTQIGVRYDSGDGPNRTWLAVGLQGLAPYWFEVEATVYIGDEGRTALRLEAEYDLLLTQRLILQPRLETTLYGKSDAGWARGSGLSSIEAGLRLRYEFSRQFAPYVGIDWVGKYGRTEDFARAEGEPTEETRVVAGIRFWF